jgi:hypothetical protein
VVLVDGEFLVAELLLARLGLPWTGPRLRPGGALVSTPLPVPRLQQVDCGGEHVLRRPPQCHLTHPFERCRRLAGQVGDEGEEPPPRARSQFGDEVEVVEALEVGLYRTTMLGEELVEADDSPTVVF